MARAREFDEDKALAAVEAVFWRQGYAASYADLMTATGLGKGSMYAAFGDKRRLFRQALARYVDRHDESARRSARPHCARDPARDGHAHPTLGSQSVSVCRYDQGRRRLPSACQSGKRRCA